MAFAADPQLLRWKANHGISDDAFDSLRSILARPGRTEMVPDDTRPVFFQGDGRLTDATHLNGGFPHQSYFEADSHDVTGLYPDFFNEHSAHDPLLNDCDRNFNHLMNGDARDLR